MVVASNAMVPKKISARLTDGQTDKKKHGVTTYSLITLVVILTHFHGANEAVVVYPISVLDIHTIHTFLTQCLHIKIWYS